MTLKKVGFYVLVIFLVAFVIKSPVAAAKVVRVTGEASGQWLSTAFDALTKFIRSLLQMIRRDRYLALDERKICEVRRHPALLLGIGLQTVGVFAVAAALGTIASPGQGHDVIDTILGLVALAFLIRLALAVMQWWLTRIIVTDRRIVEVSGVLSRRVASMPLPQVTDTTYRRSIWGRILGYGDLIVESPGRHPGLSHIGYVPRPDDFYRIVMSLMNASSGEAPDEVVVLPADQDTGEIPRVVVSDRSEES